MPKTSAPSRKPQSADHPVPAGQLFRWLWRDYMRTYRWWLVLAALILAVEGSMLALLSRMVQPMFDDVFAEGDMGALYFVGTVVFLIFCARAAASVGQRLVMAYAVQNVSADMRKHLLAHMLTLDSAFFSTNSPGQLIERVQGDVGRINSVWSGILVALSRDLVSLVGLFGVALWIDWRWTLVAIVGVPLLILPSLMVQRYIRKRSGETRVIAGWISTRLDEVFHGINPIKLNSLEGYQTGRYAQIIRDGIKANLKVAKGTAAVPALIDIMTGVGFFGVLLFGGSEIISGEKTAGEFMAFFTAMGLAFDPIRRLGNLSGQIQTAAASAERLSEVLDTRPSVTSPAAPKPVPLQAPEIVIDQVSLAYGDLPVLRDLSFTAEAGKTTALVGASGAGKSTVFNVLTRLIDPATGEIRIDGTPVRAMKLEELRGLYSVVSQDAALFDDSLRDNILLGREDVDAAHLEAVLRAAHVTDFIEKLPAGLDSPAGPRGSNLSGGQRQRVAIARALLRDTPILLLDEATSALDTKSEAIVQEALEGLSRGRTTLVIAHRLSTIRNADKIVVMDRGRAVEEGTHEHLLAKGGLYADLYNLQFSEAEDA